MKGFGLCLVFESEFLELANGLLLTSIKKKNQSSPKIPKEFSYKKKGVTLLRAFKKLRQILLSTSYRPDPSPSPSRTNPLVAYVLVSLILANTS